MRTLNTTTLDNRGIETVKESDKIGTLRLIIESLNIHLQIQLDAIDEIFKKHNGGGN